MADEEVVTIAVPRAQLSSVQYALNLAASAMEKQDEANAAIQMADVRWRPLTSHVRAVELEMRDLLENGS